MAAPFELPDICDIYQANDVVLVQASVPCRQVPDVSRGRQTVLTDSTITWTHWVDFEPGIVLQDNVTFSSGTPSLNPTPSRVLRFTFPGVDLRLGMTYVEDRFTNTGQHYKRAYCVRYLRNDV